MAAEALTPFERLEIRVALEDLNTAFAHSLDHDDVGALVDLFTEDALYTHGPRISRGRAEIERLFRSRTAAGPRTTRHLYSGLKLEILAPDRAAGTSVCMAFAAAGVPPLSPAVPALVADFNDVYVRGTDRRWRFAERHIVRVFENPAAGGPVGRRTEQDAADERRRR